MAYNLLINGVYWGYNPLTNHLLTSWDILVGFSILFTIHFGGKIPLFLVQHPYGGSWLEAPEIQRADWYNTWEL